MFNEDDFEGEEDQIINEEYKLWKYNSPYLYDTLFLNSLEWPSLSVSWLPSYENDSNIINQKIIFGTQTTNNEQNYLIIANIKLPTLSTNENDEQVYTRETINKYSSINNKIEIEYKINHQGEINKIKPMPQKLNSHIIATKSSTGEIYIYNYLNHPNRPNDLQCKPEMKLTGHTKEGFGLNWNTIKEGYLLSGSDDNRICLYDINNNKAPLLKTIEEHKSPVEDVNWNKQIENVFASCGDDRKLIIWDIRQDKPSYCIEAHIQEVNSCDFNPFNEYYLLTCSNDKTCALWDIRNLNNKVYTFQHHKNDVISVKWNYNIMSLFASVSTDRRINIWDLGSVNKHVANNDEDGPSELLFTHGGHTAKINDFDWNYNNELMCASVSEDNILQIWEMANSLYYNENDINEDN